MATRPKPRVTYRRPQPTTGRGRIVRQPVNPFVSRGTLAGMRPPTIAGQKPVAAAGVAPSGVAAPQYSVANLPPDASFDQQMAVLQRQRDEGLAAIQGERFRGLSDYGFTEGPTGTLAMDVNNAFSKASVMKHTYDTNRRATAQSIASQGQMYAGSSQNAQDLVNRNELQSQDALLKTAQAFLARNTGQRAEALTGYETAAQQADADRISRFASNPLYDPVAQAQIEEAKANAALAKSQMPGAAPRRATGRNPFVSMGTLARIRRRK